MKGHPNQELRMKIMESDGNQSVIAAVQPFSDKSQTFLNAGSLTFYPVHINVLNFTEERRTV